MPSKKVHVREYTVRAHERVITSRRYKFVCAECNQAVDRESFGPRPIYCSTCRPPYLRTDSGLSKKKPKPFPVRTASVSQDAKNGSAS